MFFTFNKHYSSELSLDPSVILKESGLKGTFIDGTYQLSIRRPHLTTVMQGVQMTSDFGLIGWLTLSGTQRQSILLGDLPLKEEEVNEVLLTVLQMGLTAPALHNRFSMDSQRIMSLHIEGLGSQEAMAKAMGQIVKSLPLIVTQTKDTTPVRLDTRHSTLSVEKMENLLWKGEMLKGVFHVSLGRATTLGQQEMGNATGVNSWASFAGSEEYAVVNGDIASLENEVPYVLRDLLKAKIQVTSIHTHLSQEQPKLLFIHFFGTGRIAELANGVKQAFWEKEHFQSQ